MNIESFAARLTDGSLGTFAAFGIAFLGGMVAVICVVLGLQMLGVINLPFDALNRFLPNTRPERRGFVGAFLFGILFGVVASPCWYFVEYRGYASTCAVSPS